MLARTRTRCCGGRQQQQFCRSSSSAGGRGAARLLRPPPLLWSSQHRRTATLRLRASNADEQQQQQELADAQEAVVVAAQARAALENVEVDILAATGAGAAEGESSADSGAAAAAAAARLQAAHQHVLADDRWRATSRAAYLALAAGLAGTGLLLAVGAVPIAAAGLRLGAGLQLQQAAALVGCVGAGVLRAASLAWFLAEGAALGELGSWRYQRANVGLGLAAASAGVAALTSGWGGAAPWLALLAGAGGVAVAALCGSLAVGSARASRGFYFASALGYGDVFQGLAATAGYAAYAATSLAGMLMAATACASLALGAGALLGAGGSGGGAAALLPAVPWLGAAGSGAGGVALLQKLLGAGLLAAGVQAWLLMEPAAAARPLSVEAAVKAAAVGMSEGAATAHGVFGPAPVHVPLRRFHALHAGFFVAAGVQAAWLATAGGAGCGAGLFNAADPLWGCLTWGVMAAAAYGLVQAAQLSYSDLAGVLLRLVDAAGGWVAKGAALLYVDWIWVKPVERR